MVRMKKKESHQLTEVELEMMHIIWQLGSCNVHQMMEQLPKERELAYTTVSTMVRILEQKQFVSSRKDGRGHVYEARVTKEEYESKTLAHLIKNVFAGEPKLLVNRLIESDVLDAHEIQQIKNLIEQRGSK